MITVAEAKSIIKSSFKPLKCEKVSLKDSLGRTVANDVFAPIPLPPFRQSAMDGYAIRIEDASQPLKLQGVIKAGDVTIPELRAGFSLRIFTGAMVPSSATAIVMQEKVEAEGEEVIINEENLRVQQNIRPVGEQTEKGSLAIAKGTVMSPGGIGFAASLGLMSIEVIKQPKIAMAITGDELIQPGNALQSGQIYESNSITIQSVAESTGYSVSNTAFLNDDFEETRSSIEQLVKSNDILILTGGISVGDYDFVWKSLDELGCEVLFYKVKQKPGKPLLVGKLGDCAIFALPGNPYAALSCYYQYVLPALDLMSGKEEIGLQTMSLPLAHDYIKKGDRAEFLKAKLSNGIVSILGSQASSMLSAFTEANAIVYLPAEVNELKKDELVEIGLL